MTRRNIDPDVTRRDDGAYWAAALVLAMRAGDKARVIMARRRLRQLGYKLDLALPRSNRRKGVNHA